MVNMFVRYITQFQHFSGQYLLHCRYSVRQNSMLVSQVKGKSLADQKSDKVFARGFLQVSNFVSVL